MSQIVHGFVATVLVALGCGAGQANAETTFVDEVRVGVLDHDTGIVGTSKEDGVDFGVEVLSPPISFLSAIGAPRVSVGALINSEGQTNQVYAALLAQRNFAHGVFSTGDAFFVEGTVGGAWHDGKLDVVGTPEDANWKSHGSHLVFRTGFGVGYRINEKWSLTARFNHISNANLAEPNDGSNDVGLYLGMKL